MTETLDARPGDMAFSVRLNSPSAKEAYEHIRHGRSQAKTVDAALMAVSGIPEPETALSWLKSEWNTNQSETVREALRRAATERDHK